MANDRIGVNVPSAGSTWGGELRDCGVGWARIVLAAGADQSAELRSYSGAGVKVLAVLARESFAYNWRDEARAYAARYRGLVSAWEIGNEPDQDSASSWHQTPSVWADLIRQCSDGIRSVSVDNPVLVGGGLVSGVATWLDNVPAPALALLSGIGVHPYGKDAGLVKAPEVSFGPVGDLLGAYARFGKPLWITEYGTDRGSRDEAAAYIGAMTRVLADDERVRMAAHFCLTDRMVPGFGLLDSSLEPKSAYHAFRAEALKEASVAQKNPWQDPAWRFDVGEGVGYAMQARKDEPRGPETYFPDGITSTTPGRDWLYFYNKRSNEVYVAPKA